MRRWRAGPRAIGVVNQTTMLATETQAIADFLKQAVIDRYGDDDVPAISPTRATRSATRPAEHPLAPVETTEAS